MSEFYAFRLDKDVERYRSLLSKMKSWTVYHEPDYLLAVQCAEYAPVRILVYEKQGDAALLPVVLRGLEDVPGFQAWSGVYDLKTPHEYSGVLASREEHGFYMEFYRALKDYCRGHGIIFGFLRFNPYREDAPAAEEAGFVVRQSDSQVYVDLQSSAEEIWQGYSSSVRRNIRQAERKDITAACVEPTQDNISVFISLYQATMNRLSAKPFFYFNDAYFRHLLHRHPWSRLFFAQRNGKILAASIMLIDVDNAYYHLSCSDFDARRDKPTEAMLAQMVLWAQKHGLNRLHLGGGGDTLSSFKARFSPYRVPYYIGSCSFDEALYDKACKLFLEEHPEMCGSKYMPLYRS